MSTVKTDSLQPTIAGNNLILKTGSGDVERVRIAPTGAMTVSSTVASTFGGSLTVNGVSTLKGKLGLGAAYSGTPVPDLDIVTSNNSSLLDPQLNTPSTTQGRAAAAFGHASTATKLFIGNSSSDVVWMQLQNTSSPSARATLSLQAMGGGVAIGATRASAPLHVFGGPRYGNYAEIRLTDEYVSNASFGILAQTGAANKAFRILDWQGTGSGDYVDRLWINSDGHIGMGTTSGINPLTYLNNTGSTPFSSVFSIIGRGTNLDTADGRIELNNPKTSSTITTSTTYGRIYFVAGGQANDNKIKALIQAVASQAGSNGGAELNFFTNNGGSSTTAQTLKMTIGRTGTVTFHAYDAGTLTTSAGGVISASDGRYKTKTRSLLSGLDLVSALSPTYYRWNADSPFASEYEELGFVAQEVAAVIPEASPEPETEKFKNYHDRAIIAVLVKSVQELKAIVDAQAVEIAQLKA